VRNSPFLPAAIAEELGAGDEEEPPIDRPAKLLAGPIGGGEQASRFALVSLQVLEPRLAGSGAVEAVHPPALGEPEVVLEKREPVLRRHHSASEKVSGHPVARTPVLEQIGQPAMTKRVDEQHAFGLQAAGDALQQPLVVPNVLEHLDG